MRSASSLIIVRCHFVDARLLDLARQVEADPSRKILFALDDAAGVVALEGFDLLRVSPASCADLGLNVADPRILWRCGDYILYLARRHRPDFTHYWMIEYDVVFNGPDIATFFDAFDPHHDVDLFITHLQKARPDWRWFATMSQGRDAVYQCLFPLLRVSGPAIDHLAVQRIADSRNVAGQLEDWPNDEAFTTTILIENGFDCRDISSLARYDEQSFAYAPLWHPLQLPDADGKLYHSVRSGRSYLAAAIKNHLSIDFDFIIQQAGHEWSRQEAIDTMATCVERDAETRLDCADLIFASGSPVSRMLSLVGLPDALEPLFEKFSARRMFACVDALQAYTVAAGQIVPDFLANLAFGRMALQSSISDYSHVKDRRLDAAGATNGSRTQLYGFHTAFEDDPWWLVGLREETLVERVTIYNRADQPDRLNAFKVCLSSDGLHWVTVYRQHPGSPTSRPGLHLHDCALIPARIGRFVRISLEGRQYLHLAQVEIFGRPASGMVFGLPA